MESIQANSASILMDYNAAYYAWVYCPESEKKMRKEILDKWRSIWFNS